MRDIPVFATEFGAASLTLSQIPTQHKAYVRIQATQDLQKLVEECVSFCRMCGAQQVYATGHTALNAYPYHTSILSMSCRKDCLADTSAWLEPVRQETLFTWKDIYNDKIQNVPNAACMSIKQAQEMLAEQSGYFVFKDENCVGIGRASDAMIKWVAATQMGAGADIVLALAKQIKDDVISLEVAQTNIKALLLYKRLGFDQDKEISRWYKIY